MHLLRRHWKVALPAGIAAAAVLYWLAFSFFGIQTLIFDDKVAEAGPEFASGAGAVDDMADDAPPTGEEIVLEMDDMVDEDVGADDMSDDGSGIVRIVEGTFGDRSHPGAGTAVVLNDGTDQRFLRLEEDFATDNGPDLNVYLSAAPPDAAAGDFDDDFVDLGELKGNIGSQNYEIPSDVDLDRYSTVVIWCVRFGVAFTTAALA